MLSWCVPTLHAGQSITGWAHHCFPHRFVKDAALLGARARGLPGGGGHHGLVRVSERDVAGAPVARVRAGRAVAAGEVVAERQRVLHPLQQAGRGREWHHLQCRSQEYGW